MTFHEVASYHMRTENEERMRWQHTATVCALLVNINKGKGKKAAKPEDFYPFKSKKKPTEDLTTDDILNLADSLTNAIS